MTVMFEITKPALAHGFAFDPMLSTAANLKAAGYGFRGEASTAEGAGTKEIYRLSDNSIVGTMTCKEANAWLQTLAHEAGADSSLLDPFAGPGAALDAELPAGQLPAAFSAFPASL